MANEEHVKLLKEAIEKKNIKTWNKWRKENPNITPDLSGANLFGANLRLVNLSGANLRLVNLSGANLEGANFTQANLFQADLIQADLSGVDLTRASLRKTVLKDANLNKATLFEADLIQADLTEAIELKPSQIKSAINWGKAFYVPEILDSLGLPPDHNEKLRKKFLEKLPEE